MDHIIDFKAEIMDKLNVSDKLARLNIEKDFNRRYEGRYVRFSTWETGRHGHSRLVVKTATIRNLIVSEEGYSLFIVTERGTSYKIHPTKGLELLKNEA